MLICCFRLFPTTRSFLSFFWKINYTQAIILSIFVTRTNTFFDVSLLTLFQKVEDPFLVTNFVKSYSCRDGVMVRACASQSVDLGSVSQVDSYQKLLKSGIYSFPVRRSANRDIVENEPASLLVVSLGKILNGMPPSSCGGKVVGPSSLPLWWPRLTEDSQTEHECLLNACTSSCIMLRTNSSKEEEEIHFRLRYIIV